VYVSERNLSDRTGKSRLTMALAFQFFVEVSEVWTIG
jgi:hypothetical protein